MQQDRQHGCAFCVVALVLFGPRLAQNHRVDRFKMAWVGGERQMHSIAIKFSIRRGTEVIFDIARTVHIFGFERATLEFVENRAVRFGHDICQHRQTSTVWHADDDIFHAQSATAFDDLFHRRDQAFPPVEAKAFCAHVFYMQEFLKSLCLNQFFKNGFAAFAGEDDLFAVTLYTLFEP